MEKNHLELFDSLLKQAIDVTTIPHAQTYMVLTTNHGLRSFIGLLNTNVLYRNGNRLMIRLNDRLCHIFVNKPTGYVNGLGWFHPEVGEFLDTPAPATIRVDLPMSPKWFFGQYIKSRDLRHIDDAKLLNRIINRLTK